MTSECGGCVWEEKFQKVAEEDKWMRTKWCHGVAQGQLQRCLVWENSPRERREQCTAVWLERRDGCTSPGQDRVVLLCCRKGAGFDLGKAQPKEGKTNGVSLMSNTC